MWFLVAIVIVVFFASQGANNDPIDGAIGFLQSLTRGRRLTHAVADDTGVVEADPGDLASQAGLTLDQYALARTISSEEGDSDNVTQGAVAWATLNEANRRGVSVAQLVLKAKNPAHDGLFGSQGDKDPASPNFHHSDRYCSTALDPYDQEGQIACAVLAGTIADITGGATKYDRPGLEKNPDKIAANRAAEGLQLVNVPGVDDGIRFWRA